jgi:hypothetical protein
MARDFGVTELVRAVRGPRATPEAIETRRGICEACDLVDASGTQLFRCSGDVCFCGAPRGQKLLRDARAEGCGCKLNFKWRFERSRCPWGRW